jgi:predicted transcriptional regulator
MTPKRLTNFRIDDALLDALQELNEREPDGVSSHVRRAIREYVRKKGVTVKNKADRKRASTRKRP